MKKRGFFKKLYERKPAEDSLFLRMLWLATAFTCFYLIGLVDPNVAYFNLGGLKLPLLLLYFWTAIFGCFMSYHYRHKEVKWLEWLGVGTVAVVCCWFLDNLNTQIQSGADIDLLLPTVHLVAGLFVSHIFELRSRFDFNFSLVVSLILVCFAATIGKGIWFGLGMFTFVVLASTLLLLDCESRTFGAVQARAMDSYDSNLTVNREGGSEKTANLLFPTCSLLLLSIVFFLFAPRAESLADQVSARFYSFLRNVLVPPEAPPVKAFSKRSRSLFKPSRTKDPADESDKELEKTDKLLDDKAAKSTAKDLGKNSSSAAKNGTGNAKDGDLRKQRNDKFGRNEFRNKGANSEVSKEPAKLPAEKADKQSQSKKNDQTSVSQNEDKTNETSANKQAGADGAEPKDSGNSEKVGKELKPAEKNPKTNSSGENAGAEKTSNSDKGFDEEKNARANDKASRKNKNKGKGKGKKGSGKGFEAKTKEFTDEGTAAKTENEESGELKGKSGASSPEQSSSSKGVQGKAKVGQKKRDLSINQPDKPDESMYVLPDSLDANLPVTAEDTEIFRVACNRTIYFREGAFDCFDGQNWTVSKEMPRSPVPHAATGYMLRDVFPLLLPSTVPAIKLSQKYHISRNLGKKIIFAGNPSEIDYPGPSIDVDSCGNLKGAWFMVKGLEYSVSADEAMYDLEAMRKQGVPSDEEEQHLRDSFERFLQIPANQSDKLLNLSTTVAGIHDNWFVQAEFISDYLRKNYKYSTDSQYKTRAKNAVDRFLFTTKTGDCKDFASAFVILCRASGIPARFVVGFTPGDFDPATGTRVVKTKNSHAWAEVYFPSCGWVPFDPTPQGTMPAGNSKESERYFSTAGQQLEKALKQVIEGSKGATTITLPAFRLPWTNGNAQIVAVNPLDLLRLAPTFVICLLLSGPLLMLLRDIAKNFRRPKAVHPASKIYLKVQKDLKSLGIVTCLSQTPGEFLAKAKEKLQEQQDLDKAHGIADALEDFVDSYNATFFGERGTTKDLERKRLRVKEHCRK